MAEITKVERLVNLTAVLLDSRRPLTRREITERVPGYPDDDASARRAFERDKDLLRGMGIPLELEPLDPAWPEDGGGYRIPQEAYALPDPGLDAEELAALHLAVRTVRLEGGPATEAIWKLGGAVAGDAAPQEMAALPEDEHLATLFDAVSSRRVVDFGYRGARRQLEPHRLVFRFGRWYVAGRDVGRDDDRSFRLDRIEGPVDVGPSGAFDRAVVDDDPMGEPTWAMGDEDPVDVDVWVDADQAGWVVSQAGEEALVERGDDGSVVVRLTVTNQERLRSFVTDLLDHAEVLRPPEVRATIVTWLEAFR